MNNIEKRKQQRETARLQIIDAALSIVRTSGWQAVSMRKIAEMIDYTPPVIYAYFSCKEDLLHALSQLGFLKLSRSMQIEARSVVTPVAQLEKMWLAYWQFALEETAFYQLMFGVGASCRNNPFEADEAARIAEVVTPVISKAMLASHGGDENAACKFHACWSVTHGLIALHFLNRGTADAFSRQVLVSTIRNIVVAEVVKA
ncbi:transcriptional regulator, TetR family [Filimonas lacunae]|uniref:Transcriptional regulator, TetR family n=1 Tax=Filimonas lacunae TaxID=477680 RepID=A0A173MC50_9BACT|nr:TetR/AcrR family transcriptional regulator [Filimonas lacunae]BAV05059.1 transcriptional regulator, TetR family [Filimonas lacunae]SIT34300.1 transcriptional regulator, TetR family [Filimonas lacunae]